MSSSFAYLIKELLSPNQNLSEDFNWAILSHHFHQNMYFKWIVGIGNFEVFLQEPSKQLLSTNQNSSEGFN